MTAEEEDRMRLSLGPASALGGDFASTMGGALHCAVGGYRCTAIDIASSMGGF